jgi:hypothetical protein
MQPTHDHIQWQALALAVCRVMHGPFYTTNEAQDKGSIFFLTMYFFQGKLNAMKQVRGMEVQLITNLNIRYSWVITLTCQLFTMGKDPRSSIPQISYYINWGIPSPDLLKTTSFNINCYWQLDISFIYIYTLTLKFWDQITHSKPEIYLHSR